MRIQRHLAALGSSALLLCTSASARLDVPANWPAPEYRFEGNPQSEAGFALGRALFYDPLLSRDGSISCASCHQQAAAFAHARHRLSHGIRDQLGKRNAPALFNLVWQPTFMWDGAVTHLEMQPLAPIANALEMDQPLPALLDKLRQHPEYPARFAAVFGSPGIDTQRLTRALAQFMGAMLSTDSAYDRAQNGGAALPALAQRGLMRFREHCAGCHREPLFSDYSYRNNGLDAQPVDPGRAAISGDAQDRGRFRVPSLRNVALTAPYMHDGRFETLDAVLTHYASGIHRSDTLDPLLADGVKLGAADRAALLAFLNTLTDEHFVRDPRFADPGPTGTAVPQLSGGQAVSQALARLLPAVAQAREPSPRHTIRNIVPIGARLAISVPPVEVLVRRTADALLIHVDDYFSNEPLSNLDLVLLSGNRALRAEPVRPGLYALPLEGGLEDPALSVRIRSEQLDLRLDGLWPEAPHETHTPRTEPYVLIGGLFALAAVLVMFRRRLFRA